MGRYSLFAVFEKEPAVVAGVIRTVLHTLVLLNVLLLDAPQLAGISLVVELVLTLFVRASVTPNVNVNTATQTTTVTTDKPQ
jgi:hypothetical protein